MLFERKPRSLVLTKVGAAYLPKVQDGFSRLKAGAQEVFGARRAEMLTVRAPVGYAVNWLASRLPNYMRQTGGAGIRIVSSVWSEESDFERYDIDIRYGLGDWVGLQAT